MSLSTDTGRNLPPQFLPLHILDLSYPLPPTWDPFPETTPQARLEQLVKEHSKPLTLRALRLTRNEADAADLVQDTFERALRFVGPRISAARARSWLMVVMHNLFVDQYRCNRPARLVRSPELLLELPALEPCEPNPLDAVSMEDVHRALTQVPQALRRVFELREIEGRSYAEIAAALQIPLVTVGTRLLRARRHLKNTLESQQPLAA